MVGPTVSVPKPSGSRFPGRTIRSSGSRFRIRALLGMLTTCAMLLPQIAVAQGPDGVPIQQVGFGMHGPYGPGQWHPHPTPYCSNGYCPPTTYEYVPSHGERYNGEHLAALGGAVRSAWYRLEYLNWTIDPFGQFPLGARRLDGAQEGTFPAIEPLTGSFVGTATQPDARAFDAQHNNGLRFSLGIPADVGDLEASVFILEQADSRIRLDPTLRFDVLPNPNDPDPLNPTLPNFFAATMLTVDGQLSDSAMILYDQGYQATHKADVFGTEANFVFTPVTPNQPLTLRPMVGFQFLSFRENLLIAGADEQVDVTDPMMPIITLNHRIDSRARNAIFAPQIGVRAEFVHEWFTIGVTPKFLLGFNRHRDLLNTSQIITQTDSSSEREDGTEFSPSFDLKVDARVHLNEHFSLFVGYQLYVLSNLSRPVGNINYDSIGGVVSNINLNTAKKHDMWIDGITVGGELRFH